MLTVYIDWSVDTTSRPAVDVDGSDTVGVLKKKVGRVLKVGRLDFTMYHEGEELGDLGVAVSQTVLMEGDTIEARPSRGCEARAELRRMGLRFSAHELGERVVLADDIAAGDAEKARVARLMVDGTHAKVDFSPAAYAGVECGYVEVVRALLPVWNVNKRYYGSIAGFSALMIASLRGHVEMVRLLLDHGAKVEAVSTNKSGTTSLTALILASDRGHEAVVKLLLAHGANTNAANSKGHTSLMLASLQGNEAVVKLLLAHGAYVNATDNRGATALMGASLLGREAVVKLLLAHGANTNAADKKGVTALMLASGYGHEAVVKLLAAHGANYRPMFAAREGRKAAVKLLAARDAGGNNRGRTALMPAHGAAGNNGGRTALMLASGHGHEAAHGAAGHDRGCTPLMLAAREGRIADMKLLAAHDAAGNDRDCTPLMLAAREGRIADMKLLAASINAAK